MSAGGAGPAVVAIGGGHGLAMILRACRTFAGTLTAVVSTADDGGSSGRLRAELGMPAPGDLRRCLDAVASDADLAAVLEHRFGTGELAGHPVGNLLLAGLVDAGHDLASAAQLLAGWLGIDPTIRVVPATCQPVELVGETSTGSVRGQVQIEGGRSIERLSVEPATVPTPKVALDAVRSADLVVLGPGSFYTSVLAAAVVPGVLGAIGARVGRLVYVANLRADETVVKGFDVGRHVSVLGAHGIRPDVVLVQEGAMALGDVGDVEVVVADVDRPHGLAHDFSLVGPALAALVD